MIKAESSWRRSILGIGVDLVNYETARRVICRTIETRNQIYVCIVNPNSVMSACRDTCTKSAFDRAGLVLPDGVGITLAARMLGYPNSGRIAGPDFMLRLCSDGRNRKFRHFFYGGAAGTADAVARELSKVARGIEIAGTFCPPFGPISAAEDAAIVDILNASAADVLWVALGAPKQEKWMAAHFGRVSAPVIIGVGAAFDFLAGTKKRAPVWMQTWGLEWLYRSCQEWRMLKRNLDNPVFLAKVTAVCAYRKLALLRKVLSGQPQE